jgi:Glycosyltransferases involved in cell wall biogenesis
MDYSIILPAYNEAATIERAIRETVAVFDPLAKEYEIIVVDDGSSDDTAGIVNSLSAELPVIRLLQHAANDGKGGSVRTGVMNARGGLILFLDCDLATHPREALFFIEKMGEYDIAIGSRRVRGAMIIKSQPWYRSLAGRFINFFVRHFLKLPHHDTQCGFKMFRNEVAQDIFKDLGPARWTFDIEVLMRAHASGYRVGELPVTWRNNANSRVKTKEVISDLWHLVKLKNKLNK